LTEASGVQFDVRRLERQFAASSAVKGVLIALVLGGWLASFAPALARSLLPIGLMGAGLVGWLIANAASRRTARLAIRASQLAASGPLNQLESTLDGALARFTLYRTVRVMLYHQLAVLRHRQRRFAESAQIAGVLLAQPNLGLSGGLRAKLLLLLGDASLHLRRLPTAWACLTELFDRDLDLTETMQLLEMQTRYEQACGYHGRMLEQLPGKVALAELMPAEACGSMHAMLAAAAKQRGHAATARWLADRTQLLGAPIEPTVHEAFYAAQQAAGLAKPA